MNYLYYSYTNIVKVLLIITFSFSSIFAQQKQTVAILDFEGKGISKQETQVLTDRFSSELAATENMILVNRDQINEILDEQGFQLSGCTSSDCAVVVGSLLGVQHMITGSIGKIGESYTIDIQLFSVETGETEKTVSQTYKGPVDGLVEEIELLAWEIMGKDLPDSYKQSDSKFSVNIKKYLPIINRYNNPIRYRGFGLSTGTEGSGITLNYQWNIANKVSLSVEGRIFDIKADDEFVTYNYYTGQYESINEQSLVILPFFGGGSYYPFEGAIANNASPYITVKFGPVISFDGNETINGFFKRWQKANGYYSVGGYIGVGVEMLWANRMTVGIGIGRDILPMRSTIDGKTSYSGTVLSFTFYQKR